MRVLVCGGRHFCDSKLVERVLDELHAKTPITVLIEGGATGADRIAFRWASDDNRCGTETYAADWYAHGRAAGPLRNARMLEQGKPDLVVAFPGGKGTADMVRRARAAGLPVHEVKAPPIRGTEHDTKGQGK